MQITPSRPKVSFVGIWRGNAIRPISCEWGRQLQSQNSKISKVTQKWLKSDFSGSTWKWLENHTKVTQKWLFPDKNDPKSHFWVTFVWFSSHFQVDPEKSLLSLSHFWVTLLIFEFWLCSCRPHSRPISSERKMALSEGFWEVLWEGAGRPLRGAFCDHFWEAACQNAARFAISNCDLVLPKGPGRIKNTTTY